jgi:hypothetical protein
VEPVGPDVGRRDHGDRMVLIIVTRNIDLSVGAVMAAVGW